ncbi:hypothetical protein ACQ4M3_17555 [Leptolyngbya sp. AN03gr2]|uniref:hypothetical protein n=1 Tax=unclassified Leptolyngbya TaxID=2650499 RepID=UPI003D323DE8
MLDFVPNHMAPDHPWVTVSSRFLCAWTLQQLGFDYTYDKRLYDRLLEQHAEPVRKHFWADLNYQNRSARFLENHGEPRAAGAFVVLLTVAHFTNRNLATSEL